MIKKLFLNNRVILTLILLNSLILFVSGFDMSETNSFIVNIIDNTITGLFLIELIVKFREFGVGGYYGIELEYWYKEPLKELDETLIERMSNDSVGRYPMVFRDSSTTSRFLNQEEPLTKTELKQCRDLWEKYNSK